MEKTNKRIISSSLLLILFLAIFQAALMTPAAAEPGNIIRVPDDYSTIQAAIDVAGTGDTVRVAEATYYENIVMKDGVTIEGGWDSSFSTRDISVYETIIDGGGIGSVVIGANNSKIDGFTITNGNATNTAYRDAAGGGIYCNGTSPTIINNKIIGNIANNTGEGGGAGGGIALTRGASPTIKNNIITENYATTDYWGHWWESGATAGGGILVDWNSEPIIEDNVIADNYGYNNNHWGHSAGGIAVVHWANATITRNTITRNVGDQDASGGGLVVTFGSEALIDRNVISYNNATNKRTRYSAAGGGLFADKGAKVLITNNLFLNNSAIDTATADKTGGDAGGAIMQKWEGNDLRVINNVIYGNYAESAVGYAAGGICQGHWTPQLTITNNIIWNNRVGVGNPAKPDLRQYRPDENEDYVTYNDISQEPFPGVGNIQADPLFVDPALNDFHLQLGSPAIDAGTNIGAPPIDLDGNPRPLDGNGDGVAVVDMGAYEFTVPALSATIDIDPDTLNLKSNGQWITAYITLPEGYNVEDIDLTTVEVDGISATWSEIQNGVYMAKFDRLEVKNAITDMPDYEMGNKFVDITLAVTGEVAGTPFEGSDTITVIKG